MDSTGWLMLSLVVLLALSAFFSSSETAYTTVNKIRLKALAGAGEKRARKALAVTDDYDKALSTVLIGNNIVNIAASSIATVIAMRLLNEQIAAAVSTVVMTILVLIFGEVCPKSYAKSNAESIALRFAGPMHALMVFFTPISKLLVVLTDFVNRASQGTDTPSVTEEELKYIIETTVEEGVLHENESELLQSAIDFDDIKVQEILTPRVDMAALDIADDLQSILEFILEERYSRIPVFEGSIDKIVGILHTRDFLEALATGKTPDVRGMLCECLYVHKTMKIAALLGEFKRTKINIAVVMDDYGGTMGIVTTEDILEELVGEIWDEDDEIVSEFVQLDKNLYEVAGDLSVREMLEKLDLPPDAIEADSNSVGGWALEEFSRIPDAGDAFDFENLTVTVKEIFEQRIIKLQVLLHEPDRENRE